MGASVASVQALPEYRLRVCFCNGSEAIVNMERRIQAIRFHKLADPGLFETAQAQGDAVIWKRGGESIHATISELRESMRW